MAKKQLQSLGDRYKEKFTDGLTKRQLVIRLNENYLDGLENIPPTRARNEFYLDNLLDDGTTD